LPTHPLSLHDALPISRHILPQAPTKLLDILPLPLSSLPDIVHVVWVGRPVRNVDILRDHFSVRTRKVYDVLVWLIQNNEDYKDVDRKSTRLNSSHVSI